MTADTQKEDLEGDAHQGAALRHTRGAQLGGREQGRLRNRLPAITSLRVQLAVLRLAVRQASGIFDMMMKPVDARTVHTAPSCHGPGERVRRSAHRCPHRGQALRSEAWGVPWGCVLSSFYFFSAA